MLGSKHHGYGKNMVVPRSNGLFLAVSIISKFPPCLGHILAILATLACSNSNTAEGDKSKKQWVTLIVKLFLLAPFNTNNL